MEKSDIIEKLMNFNLSRQEALVYICLCEYGKLTGYEASKLTGISRSNVYQALNVLADKGAAVVTETNTTLYSPVALAEFLTNKIFHMEEDKAYLMKHMPKEAKSEDGYITIQGYRNIKDKIRNMIEQCDMRLYLAASNTIIKDFEDVLEKAHQKGIKIVIMSDKDYSRIATKCYYDQSEEGQIRLITDSTFVLTGEIQKEGFDTCLYSGQKNLVTIMKEALRNKIRLLELESI